MLLMISPNIMENNRLLQRLYDLHQRIKIYTRCKSRIKGECHLFIHICTDFPRTGYAMTALYVLCTGQKSNFSEYAQKVEQFMFDIVETESKDAEQLCASTLQLLDGDLMTLIQKDFPSFQSPDKSNGQDEDQGIDPLQFGQMGIFKIEPPAFTGAKKYFDPPTFTIQLTSMS